MSELETNSETTRKFDCAVCGISTENVKQLKTHILLKHSDLHLCLFCVEKKGWSDDFASGASYNEHYWRVHQGIIQKNEKIRNVEKIQRKSDLQKWKSEVDAAVSQGLRPPKRPCPKLVCRLCPKSPEFESGSEFDRHFLVLHKYDYCKICFLMGPASPVRLHILTSHRDQLCHICCGTSPRFEDLASLNRHLANKHALKTSHDPDDLDGFRVIEYPCLDCDLTTKFSSPDQLVDHLNRIHRKVDESLRVMMIKRKKARNPEFRESGEDANKSSDESLLPPLARICGVKNETGLDCFSIAGLHLLAQTDISNRLTVKDHHSNCPSPSCLLANLMSAYHSSKRRVISDKPLVDHYDKMGLQTTPADCGDFLRCCLKSVCADPPEHATEKEDLTPVFKIGLEWKFECPKCMRFSVVNMNDFVLKIDGSIEGSLEDLLNRFLHQKQCRCGSLCQVYPGVRSAGKYILIEIDRSVANDNDDDDADEEVKDLALYSLQLNESYNIFGFRYALLGTISYKLDSDDGGHFVTHLFPNKEELIRIHETEWKTIKRIPDFDVDTVVIALQKVEMTANDLRRIELEIEYETVAPSSDEIDHEPNQEPLEETNVTISHETTHSTDEITNKDAGM